MELQKELAYDKLAIEKGIEHLHIDNAVKEFKLKEDDDFKNMMAELQLKAPDVYGPPKKEEPPAPVKEEKPETTTEDDEDLGW